MRRVLALVLASSVWLTASIGFAQTATPSAEANANANAVSSSAATSANVPTNSGNQAVIIRDPRNGQLYQQEFQTVDQPVTTWQRRMVDRTIVTPQTVMENQQVPQTLYVPKTEYVMQARLKGWWNPFAQPVYAYEYVPVTRWVPQTQMVTRQVPAVKMVQSTEKIAVDQPVQTTQKVTHVVLKPLPQNSVGGASAGQFAANPPPAAMNLNTAQVYTPNWAYQRAGYPVQRTLNPTAQSYSAFAAATNAAPVQSAYGTTYPNNSVNRSQPLIASVPVLGQMRPAQWQPGPVLTAPVNGLRNVVRAATAPLTASSTYPAYAPAMNIAARSQSTWSRDSNQAGMPATVVR